MKQSGFQQNLMKLMVIDAFFEFLFFEFSKGPKSWYILNLNKLT